MVSCCLSVKASHPDHFLHQGMISCNLSYFLINDIKSAVTYICYLQIFTKNGRCYYCSSHTIQAFIFTCFPSHLIIGDPDCPA